MTSADLGFTYKVRKSGEVEVSRHGSRVSVLRGATAEAFLAEAEHASLQDLQSVMAKLTGNYKRGNERRAAEHPRNRRP